MIIVQLLGGLGSQMSQYAYAKSLNLKGYIVKIDISAFDFYKLREYELDNFNIDLEISSEQENDFFKKNNIITQLSNSFFGKNITLKLLNKIGNGQYNNRLIKEKNFLFDKNLLNIPDNSYLIGDFKSEKYFKEIRSILINQFTIKHKCSIYFKKMKEKIKSAQNTCFIHVRRGDFATKKNVREIHGLCSKNYYLRAAEHIQSKFKDIHFFIFSDDISWCKENINLKKMTFMENNNRYSPNEDIILMSMCDHSIIDHSAFCWWGAWLNQYPNSIVISPYRWFLDEKLQQESKDIYCDNWIKMPNN